MNRPGLDKNQFMTEKRVFYLCLNDHMMFGNREKILSNGIRR